MSLSLSSGPFKLETTGDGLQYYDQVCAVSQAAINQGFVNLFEKQPLAARSVNWRNYDVFDGQLVATMLPPQIELDVESEGPPKFTLQLRFEKGRISFGRNTYQTIDGWVIAFGPLSFETCLDASIVDLVAAEAVENIEEDVIFKSAKPTKMIPGEFSIHRLFAAIADLDWGSIIWERSYMIQPSRQKWYLDEWARDPVNNALYNEVQQCLREWVLGNTLASCFTQGMLLKVPKPKVSSGKVTFASRKLQLQNYPYIDEAKQITMSNAKQAMKGINGSPYNCLCFCEVVGSRVDLPSTKFLPFSGNLAGPSKDKSNEYLGTFVIDSRRFPKNQVMSQLQELCIAMQTIPLEPEVRLGGNYLPSGRRQQIIGNTIDLTAGKPYRWSELANTTGTAARSFVSVAGRKTKTSSMSKITIEAGPQMTAYKVTGEYGYSRRTDFSSVTIIDIASWSFTISVSGLLENVTDLLSVYLQPQVDFKGCKIEKDPFTGLDMLIPDDFAATLTKNPTDPTWLLIRLAMKVNIGRALMKIKTDLNPFKSIPKFMYPGNGELKFGPTMFNEDFNLFATIDYSLKESRVGWPGAKALVSNLPTYISDTTVTKDVPNLVWSSIVNTHNPVNDTIRLTLTGTNRSTEPKAFKSLTAVCLKMKTLDGSTLFQAEPQRWAKQVSSDVRFSEMWSIVTSGVDTALELKTESLASGIQFKISPTVLGTAKDGSSLPSKFIIPPLGSFTMELQGVVSTKDDAGTFILQLDEAWVGVRPNKTLQGRASTFFQITLEASGKLPAVATVTQATADEIRGVPLT